MCVHHGWCTAMLRGLQALACVMDLFQWVWQSSHQVHIMMLHGHSCLTLQCMLQVHVFVGGVEEKLVANKAITQHVLIMAPYDNKNVKLQEILRSFPPGTRIIIFCSTKRMCDTLSRDLRNVGAAAIHGDKKQSERDWVIGAFKAGTSPIMVATDVAARGLDVSVLQSNPCMSLANSAMSMMKEALPVYPAAGVSPQAELLGFIISCMSALLDHSCPAG